MSVYAIPSLGSGNSRALTHDFRVDSRTRFSDPHVVVESEVKDPTSVFAADLDGDDDLDLLVASLHDGKIAWYENTDGLGTYGTQRVIREQPFASAYGASPRFTVQAADFDGDGDQDVLFSYLCSSYDCNDFDDDTIGWYENLDGAGNFGPLRLIADNAVDVSSVFAADLDGDGDMDVLAALPTNNAVAWYENTDGLGTFGPRHVITTNALYTRSVFAADLDGDNDLDVLSASADDGKFAWYENTDGLGTFGPQHVITTNADGANSIVAADLDGDGDLDVLGSAEAILASRQDRLVREHGRSGNLRAGTRDQRRRAIESEFRSRRRPGW